MRVLIRAPRREDEELVLSAMRASRGLYGRWMTPMTSRADFERLLERAASERYEPLLLCRREDGVLVGYFSINEIIRGVAQMAYLGYGAFAPHNGRGYMREGLQLVLAHAFGPLRLHRLEANIQPDNAASIALVRGAGFVREGYSERYLKIAGRWRDHERWAIRSELWRPTRGG